MRRLVFATNNRHKFEEVLSILNGKVELLGLKDIRCFDNIPEPAATLEGNALAKARYVRDKYGYDCFADDTGLEVEALNKAPGVYSARYAGDAHDAVANMNKLLKRMQGNSNRKARFRTVIALAMDGREYTFEGVVNGVVITEPRGAAGFGYDPLFVPEGYTQTFAELGEDIKNTISHRAMAIRKLATFLSTNNVTA
jgi:XTP/dITP diphosphohydrolase